MADINEISSINYQSFPYLIPVIKYCAYNYYEKPWAQEPRDIVDYEFIFVTEGAAKYTMGDKVYNIKKNDLLIQKPLIHHYANSTSTPLGFLCIHLDLYAHMEPNFAYVNENNIHEEIPTGPIQYNKVDINLPDLIEVEDSGYIHLLFERIKKEIDEMQNGFDIIVKSNLLELLVYLFRKTEGVDEVLNNVDTISIWSHNNNDIPLQKGMTLCLSDFKIWSGDSDGDNSSGNGNLLGTMLVNTYYIEHPDNNELSVRLDDSDLYNNKGTLKITANETTPYKLWFWQEPGIKALDLRPYKGIGFLRFSYKSNRKGTVGLCIYNHLNYNAIIDDIKIIETDTWQTVTIPISHKNGNLLISPHIQKAINYIKKNYMNKVQIAEIANSIHLHPTYLCILFKKQVGISLGEFIKNYRIQIAKNLLLESDDKIEDIAYNTGFYDLHHFSRVFKTSVGISPTIFRKQKKIP